MQEYPGMTLTLRFPNGRNVLSAAIYGGTLFLWVGRAVGQHRSWSWSFILNDASLSQTGSGRWSW
jgi:hypothetical protein